MVYVQGAEKEGDKGRTGISDLLDLSDPQTSPQGLRVP